MSAASLCYRFASVFPWALMLAATQVATLWAAAGDAPPQSKAPVGEPAPVVVRGTSGLPATVRGAEIQTAKQFKSQVKAAVRRPIGSSAATRSEQVHELVHLYGQLNGASQLSNAERKKLRIQVRSRLLKISQRLSRDESNHGSATVSKNVAKTSATKSQASAAGAPGGGAVAASAAELVELIQTTIAPETWDVNGGEGSIVYYAPLQCLVIRQTSEVHHQVGGVVRGLRP